MTDVARRDGITVEVQTEAEQDLARMAAMGEQSDTSRTAPTRGADRPLSRALFSRAKDEWETPQAFFDVLDREFHFEMDAAALRENAKMLPCITPEIDALVVDWFDAFCEGDASEARASGVQPPICWLNPPYSKCRAFIAKAASEARKGCTVVCLIPSRTDTRMWHEHIWDRETHTPRPGVEVRFVKGRLKFGGSTNSAPFPSAVVIFRPVER